MKGKVIILDFGSQYTQLIARRVRELNVFCEIYPYNTDLDELGEISAVILSGSPFSVRDEKESGKCRMARSPDAWLAAQMHRICHVDRPWPFFTWYLIRDFTMLA